jgi:acyl carrier protein
MSIKSIIISEIETVAKEQTKELAPLSDDLPLEDTGLDSLCWATIVARLETSLGVDPFLSSEEVNFPVTVGEFVHSYENALL